MNKTFWNKSTKFSRRIVFGGSILVGAFLFSTCTSCSTDEATKIPLGNITEPTVIKPEIETTVQPKSKKEIDLDHKLKDIKVTKFEYNNQSFIIVEYNGSWELEKL